MDDLERALGRVPEHRVVSDGRSSSSATTRGCRSCSRIPDAAISQDVARIAASCWPRGGAGRRRAPLGSRVADPRPDRRLRLRVSAG
jgi:hypothetical protein